MKDVYTFSDLQNWDRKSPIRLGVFGDPIAHSLSPQLQNAALMHAGISIRYARFQIGAEQLLAALRCVSVNDFLGLNLTIPHKVAALEFFDEIEDDAREIGAVNCVRIRNGKLLGSNTDGGGFSRAVREAFGKGLDEFRVLILGAGGGSRAIVAQCKKGNCRAISVWSRREDRESLGRKLADNDLIVNATPVGLDDADEPLVRRESFSENHFVFDTIYEPRKTRLLIEAEAAGAQIANGISMLVHQGAASFEKWFDRPAPLAAMQKAVGYFPA